MNNHFDIQRHIPLTWATIPYLIWDIVENAWPNRGVIFTAEHPREDVAGPVITWWLQRRVPGLQGVETFKQRKRSEDTDEDGNITETYGQNMVAIFQFDIYALGAQAVNDLTVDFEELMFSAEQILQACGVKRWKLDEQLSETFTIDSARETGTWSATKAQEMYRRSLRYRCIYENKIRRSPSLIRSIALRLFGSEQLVISEPIVHSTQDTLAKLHTDSILLISDSPIADPYLEAARGYLSEVDYNLIVDSETGASSIEWVEYGKTPAIGATYYVSYLYRDIVPPQTNTLGP